MTAKQKWYPEIHYLGVLKHFVKDLMMSQVVFKATFLYRNEKDVLALLKELSIEHTVYFDKQQLGERTLGYYNTNHKIKEQKKSQKTLSPHESICF